MYTAHELREEALLAQVAVVLLQQLAGIIFSACSWYPLSSKREMMLPTTTRCTPSGLTMMSVTLDCG